MWLIYVCLASHSKAGIADIFEGHQGPVTGLDCHTVPGQIDFSPYFITSSFDWTVKLWNIKVRNSGLLKCFLGGGRITEEHESGALHKRVWCSSIACSAASVKLMKAKRKYINVSPCPLVCACRRIVPCTHSRTTATMCMMPSGHPSIQLCLPR